MTASEENFDRVGQPSEQEEEEGGGRGHYCGTRSVTPRHTSTPPQKRPGGDERCPAESRESRLAADARAFFPGSAGFGPLIWSFHVVSVTTNSSDKRSGPGV